MPFIAQGKANLKYILIVVILAAIVGGGILLYQYWWLPKQEAKTPEMKPLIDETANWKTYISPNNIFSISYPPQLYEDKQWSTNLQDGWRDEGVLSTVQPVNDILENRNDFMIEFLFGKKYPEEALEDFITRKAKYEAGDIYDSNAAVLSKQGIKVDGRDSLWAIDGMGPEHIVVYIPKNDTEVIIATMWGNEFPPALDQQKIFRQMLSTFKFIEEDETSNWKTYTSNLLGITFQHPSSWQADIDHSTVKDLNSNRSFTVIKNFIGGYVEDNLISKEDFEIDGIKTSIAYQNYENNTIAAYVFLRRDGIIYYMVGIWPKEDMEAKDIFKKILSTFKFIENKEDFCGSSTYGSCASYSDCMTGGCSGQVCQSKNEEPVITTCEWASCYDETQYGLSCKCVENKCQWAK